MSTRKIICIRAKELCSKAYNISKQIFFLNIQLFCLFVLNGKHAVVITDPYNVQYNNPTFFIPAPVPSILNCFL